MHLIHYHKLLLLFLLSGMLMLSSCGTTPQSKFYTLEAMQASTAVPASKNRQNEMHVGIGPIQLAEYLNRTQIVTRSDDAEVSLAETHRWAEPIHDNFARILAENLSNLMHTDKVSLYPSRNWKDIDYQVLVSIWQFDASKQGEAILVANWSLRGKGGSELLAMKKSAFSTELEPEASYPDMVRALSKTVELLSREIAAVIASEQGH